MKYNLRTTTILLFFLHFFVALVFLLVMTYRFYYLDGDYADSAMFENIAILASPPGYESEFLKSVQVLIRRFVSIPHPVSVYAFPTDSGLDGLLIGAHAYLIMPLISFFSKLFGFKLFTAITASAITTLPFFILLNFFRRPESKIRVKELLISALILVFYPAILWSGLGQFYPDRLFMIFFPIFLLFLNASRESRDRRSLFFFFVFALLSLSVTERGAVYVGVACLIFALFSRKNHAVIFLTGFASLAWSLFYYKSISSDIYPDSFFDQAKSLKGIIALLLTTSTLKLILFHLPGLLLLRKMRDLQILLIVAMGPNFLGNIGGAEKIGWVTHYMSYLAGTYIGVILIYATRMVGGVLNASEKSISKEKWFSGEFRVGPILAPFLSIILVFVNPISSTELFDANLIERSGIFGKSFQWIQLGARKTDYELFVEKKEYLIKTIPKNARIGVSEATAKYVSSNFRNIYLFPAGIEKLDFVVLRSSASEMGIYQQDSIVNYASAEVSRQLTAQIQTLLLSKCFKDITPQSFYPIHILKRNPDFELVESCST